jgi:pyruvate kinase
MPTTLREPLGSVRTKIVATVGPASRDPATLRALVEAGADVFRLNFSHGTHDEHTAMLRAVRAVAEESDHLIAVLQDLGGPKIRLGPIPGDVVECHVDEEFVLAADRVSDDPHELTCTYRALPGALKPGEWK